MPALREQMILNNRKLAYKIARKICTNYNELDDFISIALIGLIKAVDHYDASYGAAFSSYAVPVITNEILMSLRSKKRNLATVSMNEPTHDNLSISDFIPDDTDVEAEVELACILNEYSRFLTDKEAAVMAMKVNGVTQRAIAKRVGLSQPHISRIVMRAQAKLRAAYQEGVVS